MAVQTYGQLVKFAKAKGLKPRLDEKAVKLIIEAIMNAYLDYREETLFRGVKATTRENKRAAILQTVVRNRFRGINFPPFPASASGRKNAVKYELDVLKGLFLKALEQVPTPIK